MTSQLLALACAFLLLKGLCAVPRADRLFLSCVALGLLSAAMQLFVRHTGGAGPARALMFGATAIMLVVALARPRRHAAALVRYGQANATRCERVINLAGVLGACVLIVVNLLYGLN